MLYVGLHGWGSPFLPCHIPPLPHGYGVHSHHGHTGLKSWAVHHLKTIWRLMNNQWKRLPPSQSNSQHNLAKCHYHLVWFYHEVFLLSEQQMIFTRSKAEYHAWVLAILNCIIKTPPSKSSIVLGHREYLTSLDLKWPAYVQSFPLKGYSIQ